jgi:xanthine/uracil/vitamin C permease (AzgA family)
MANRIARFFHFAEHGTNLRREIIAAALGYFAVTAITAARAELLLNIQRSV